MKSVAINITFSIVFDGDKCHMDCESYCGYSEDYCWHYDRQVPDDLQRDEGCIEAHGV